MFTLKIISIISITFKLIFANGVCHENWPKCGDSDNVVCRHGGNCDSKSSDCKPVILTNDLRNSLTVQHNNLRNIIAGGRDKRGGARPGGNIMVMNYDLDLEYTASCTANTCKMEHESCRITKTFSTAGQNLYAGDSINNAVGMWYHKEIVYMTRNKFDKFGDYMTVGHFTQVVWASTTHVGCAAAKKGNTYYVACNYGPAGNVQGLSVYVRGDPASNCPKGVEVCRKYRSLCGVAYKLHPTGRDFVEMSACKPFLEKLIMYILIFILFLF